MKKRAFQQSANMPVPQNWARPTEPVTRSKPKPEHQSTVTIPVAQALWLGIASGCAFAVVVPIGSLALIKIGNYIATLGDVALWTAALSAGAGLLTFSVSLFRRMAFDLYEPIRQTQTTAFVSQPKEPEPESEDFSDLSWVRAPAILNAHNEAQNRVRAKVNLFIRRCAEGNTALTYWERKGLDKATVGTWRDALIRAGWAEWKNPKALHNENYRPQGWQIVEGVSAEQIIANLDGYDDFVATS